MIFIILIAPVIAGYTLLFCVIPSVILYRRGKHFIDRLSVYLSSSTLGIVVIAWVVFEPLRRWIIFGRH